VLLQKYGEQQRDITDLRNQLKDILAQAFNGETGCMK
jgi:hypothetical protein